MNGRPLADVHLSHEGALAVASLTGEVDLSNAQAMERTLLAAPGDAAGLVLDLGGLDYLDSAGMAMVDRLARAFAETGRTLVLVAPPGSVARTILQLARYGGVPVSETVEAAVLAHDG